MQSGRVGPGVDTMQADGAVFQAEVGELLVARAGLLG